MFYEIQVCLDKKLWLVRYCPEKVWLLKALLSYKHKWKLVGFPYDPVVNMEQVALRCLTKFHAQPCQADISVA